MSNHFLGWFYHRLSFWWVKNPHLYVPTSICLVGYSNLYIYIIYVLCIIICYYFYYYYFYYYIYIHITLYIYICMLISYAPGPGFQVPGPGLLERVAGIGWSLQWGGDRWGKLAMEAGPMMMYSNIVIYYYRYNIYIYIVSYVAMMYSNMCDVQLYCNDIVCISYIFIACIYNMTVSIYIHIYTRMCM